MPKPTDMHTPSVREADGRGVPEKDDSAEIGNREHDQAPTAPKTSGAPPRGKEPLPNPAADRNVDGPRVAGTTPRPPGKPIVGSQR
ncbi:MAG: hypothetical protein ACTHJ3_05325 [Pararhizobium sp.]